MIEITCKNPKCKADEFYWEDDYKTTKKMFKFCPYCGGKELEIKDEEYLD